MPRNPKGKKALTVYIDEELLNKLYSLIHSKYKAMLRGTLSAEVEAAIQAWLALHEKDGHTQIHTKPNPFPRYRRVYEEVKEWLFKVERIDITRVNQIPRALMVKAIMAVRGSDKRTVDKWLKVFTQQGMIKWITPELVELVG